MNKLKQLPRLMIFSEIAQKGSFTEAASSLGITKSAVSQQITQLEHDLGSRILNRNTRGVHPTALGKKLLKRCQSLKEQVDLMYSDIANSGANPEGNLKVTFPHALESSVILPAFEQLCFEYPGIQPELVASDYSLDLVSNNLDLAIHVGELPDSTYRALPVGTLTEIFCATPLYISKHGLPTTVEQLSKHRWIATGWQNQSIDVRCIETGDVETVTFNKTASANTLPSAMELGMRNMGILLLPDLVAIPKIQSGELIHLVKEVTGPLWPVYTLHAYQHEKPIQVTRFHQLVHRFFNTKYLV